MATGLHAQNDGVYRLVLLRGERCTNRSAATVETVGGDRSFSYSLSETSSTRSGVYHIDVLGSIIDKSIH